MIDILLEPFAYSYMTRAIWVSALVGGVCAFLSCYLVLKGWSMMGDALAHAVVPGVAIAAILGGPYALGAFASGLFASLGIAAVRRVTRLREDAVIGVVFTVMFASGLLLISAFPTAVNLQSIIMGNVLAIGDAEIVQVVAIATISLGILAVRWRDLLLAFFDEAQARVVGIHPFRLRLLFFGLLSACIVAALQTVGAVLVIAMVVTPGATAYLLTDRFGMMILIAVAIGVLTSAIGAYISFFTDGATGPLIVTLMIAVFALAFVFAPKHGHLAQSRAAAGDRAATVERS